MSDVTIPASQAAQIAYALRQAADGRHAAGVTCEKCEVLRAIASQLDPPPPSLRDDVAEALRQEWENIDIRLYEDWHTTMATAALAVVRRHVQGMDLTGSEGPRNAMLRLLGGVE